MDSPSRMKKFEAWSNRNRWIGKPIWGGFIFPVSVIIGTFLGAAGLILEFFRDVPKMVSDTKIIIKTNWNEIFPDEFPQDTEDRRRARQKSWGLGAATLILAALLPACQPPPPVFLDSDQANPSKSLGAGDELGEDVWDRGTSHLKHHYQIAEARGS